MSELVPCPLCGGRDGYSLDKGDTYRWFNVVCIACGEQVSECRAGENRFDDSPPPGRTILGDEAWETAGAYAEGLRVERDRLSELNGELLEALKDCLCELSWSEAGNPKTLSDARAAIAKATEAE